MKDAHDQLLEDTVREWSSNKRVRIAVIPEGRGGPQVVEVLPHNVRSVSLRLWVADDAQNVACSIGGGSWWDPAVALECEAIVQLLEAVKRGAAWEEVQSVGKHVLGRRGCIRLHSKRLSYGWPIGFPGIKWRQEPHEAY